MSVSNWPQIWQNAQNDPDRSAALALLLLNGLTLAHLASVPQAQLDLNEGWLTTPDGDTYPLVRQSWQALRRLATTTLDHTRWQEAVAALAPLGDDSQRRLAGAIWLTDPEHQRLLETIGQHETPILPLENTFPFSITGRLQAGETSSTAVQARETLQRAADWLETQTLQPRISLWQRALSLLRQGSLVFLVASTGVSGLNLIHNVLMGRLLSPADYSQLTFIITLQLIVGLLPTAMQTVTARFTARYQAQQRDDLMSALRHQMRRLGWLAGFMLAALLLLLTPLFTVIFQLDGYSILLPFVLVVPFFIRMGADRGFLQGVGGYNWLSGAYVAEGVVRLGMGVLLGYALLSVGRSLEGAVWGFVQSMLVTWFITWLAMRQFKQRAAPAADITDERREWWHIGGMTGLVLIGQALITNSDFLLVKNFFTPDEAGLYAAVSVLGRIVYFGALPLQIVLVPLVARRQALNEPTSLILLLLIVGGLAVCGALIVLAALFAPQILSLLYGEAYLAGAGLLAPYALAASLYTLTNLVITYQIALGSGGETGLPILAGLVQIVAVFWLHESLLQVVAIQIALMGLLFGVVLWRVWRADRQQRRAMREVSA